MTQIINQAIDQFFRQDGMDEYGDQMVVGHIEMEGLHHLTPEKMDYLPKVLALSKSSTFDRRVKGVVEHFNRPLKAEDFAESFEEVNFTGFKMTVLTMMGMNPRGTISGYGAFQVRDVSIAPFETHPRTYIQDETTELDNLFVFGIRWHSEDTATKTIFMLPVRQFLNDTLSVGADFMTYTYLYKGEEID